MEYCKNGDLSEMLLDYKERKATISEQRIW
jgi:hypothetical protein